MDSTFELAMPWWHFVLRGTAVYFALLFCLRLTGKRSFGEMAAFDIIVLILVGGVLRSAVVGRDTSVLGGLIGVASILSMDKLLGWLCARSERFNRIVEGFPVLLAHEGSVVPGALRQHDVPNAAFERALHSVGIEHLENVRKVILEPNGRITVIKR
jgi:uncharacterized membrane protein YcaP (DUF421 family)